MRRQESGWGDGRQPLPQLSQSVVVDSFNFDENWGGGGNLSADSFGVLFVPI